MTPIQVPEPPTRRCRTKHAVARPGDWAVTVEAWRAVLLAAGRNGTAVVPLAGWTASLGFVHRQHRDVDLRTYRGAVISWAHGRDPYAFYGIPRNHTLGFINPPFAAVLMSSLSSMLTSLAYLRWSTAIAASYALLVWWVLPEWLRQPGRRWLAVVVGVGLFYLCPIQDTFPFGQVNISLALAVVADCRALRRGSHWAGIGIGLLPQQSPRLCAVLPQTRATSHRPPRRRSVRTPSVPQYLWATGWLAG